MAATAKAKVAITLSVNGMDHAIVEGDVVNNLKYLENGIEKVITGKVRVIAASTEKQNVDPHTCCPPDPYLDQYIKVSGVIIDSSVEKEAILTRIALGNILDIERVTPADEADGIVVVGVGEQYKSLADVLSEAKGGEVIKLMPGVYEEPVTITKSVTITGEAGAVLTKLVKVEGVTTYAADAPAEPIDVTIDGVIFNADAFIDIVKADSFTMRNCIMENLTSPEGSTNAYAVKIAETPMKVVIEGNKFKASALNSDKKNKVYNGIECIAKLLDGSSISNNSFFNGWCAHNTINIYGAANDAVIHVDYNWFEDGVYRTRIGTKGAPKDVVIYYQGNKGGYVPDEWGGLVLFQPYGTATETMGGLTVLFDGNDNAGNPLCYLYSSSGLKFDTTNSPVIFIDGEKIEVPGDQCEDRAAKTVSLSTAVDGMPVIDVNALN